jgi:hypothetical protein
MDPRMKIADLTSGVGAAVLGVGLGAWFAPVLGRYSAVIAALGLTLHSVGMWDKHRLESSGPQPRWVVAAYWVCWILLGAVAIALITARLPA